MAARGCVACGRISSPAALPFLRGAYRLLCTAALRLLWFVTGGRATLAPLCIDFDSYTRIRARTCFRNTTQVDVDTALGVEQYVYWQVSGTPAE